MELKPVLNSGLPNGESHISEECSFISRLVQEATQK